MNYIPYGRQYIDKKDKKAVLSSLSNSLITTGPLVDKFEKQISKYLKCKYSYVCSSGTAAIHLAMLSVGLRKNDVILMPAVNFIASYNMAQIIGLRVYLVDVDEFTGQITPETTLECIKKNKLKKINSLLVMYNGGYPQYVKEFYYMKKKFNFSIIEDACHAFGSEYEYKNKYHKIGVCKHADVSTFSLHPLKTITSGEGGIITTNNIKIANNIKIYRNHGIIRKKNRHWEYDIIKNGYNYRLSDINCALGISQIKKVNFFLKKRKKIFYDYVKVFKNFNNYLKIPLYLKKIKPSYHLFLINISFNKISKKKNNFLNYLKLKKIFAQQHYIPIYKYSIFKNKKNKFPGSERYFNNTVSIPIYPNLTYKNQKKVINSIKEYFNI